MCSFSKKDQKRLFSNCNLFKRTFTNKGIGFTFNNELKKKLYKNSENLGLSLKIFHVNDNNKVVNMKSAGSNYGLKVLVEKNMEELERYENDKNRNMNLKPIDVSVTLHNPKEPANIRNKGFEIPLGHSTKVYITPKAREIDDSGKDLTEIQRGCRLAKDSKDLDSFNIYSQESCHLECMIKQSYKKCGCYPWNYLITEKVNLYRFLFTYSNCDAPLKDSLTIYPTQY